MVAIFTGIGAGVERSSANIVGGAGQYGRASYGRGGESISVNAATGNLVISRRDEFLVGRGHDASVTRTYNSVAETGDRDNGDQWQQSTTLRVFGQAGALNTAGSSIKRLGADGSVITYTYETRGSQTAYWSDDGAGAHDKLIKSGSQWIWTDGDTQTTEKYSAATASGEFRIVERADIDNNRLTFQYVSGTDKVSRIKTANNEYVEYSWSGNNITQILTRYTDGGEQTLIRTRYEYSANRLSKVITDLSPENKSIADGDVYETTYTYDGASDRIRTITQTDGSQITIDYDALGRVTAITQQIDDDTSRTTQIGYGFGVTSVTNPDGSVTKLWHDSKGQLVQIQMPVPEEGGEAVVQQFEYDDDGNIIRTIETTAENGSAPGNLIKASSWADGEYALRGDNLVDDSGWPQDTNAVHPPAGSIGQNFNLHSYAETEWTTTMGPYGENVVSLHTGQTDSSAPGGGAFSPHFDIDKSQTYEFSIYVKADQLLKHQAYFGLGSGVVKAGHNGVYSSNPYFTSSTPSNSWGADKWVKIVGYVLPDRTATAPVGSYGGIYDVETGQKIQSINHFVWDTSQSGTTTYTRFFNYYSAQIPGKFTHWVRPEVRQVHSSAILKDSDTLDVARDAAIFNAPLSDGWINHGSFANDDEARWSSVDGPEGAREVSLQSGEFDGVSNGGGNLTNKFAIDGSKAYKVTQYVRKSDLSRHSLYIGFDTWGTDNFVFAHNGGSTTNPYVLAWNSSTQRSLMEEDTWYKVVAYVLPEGSPNLTTSDLGGVFDAETGARIGSVTNFRWNENRTSDEASVRFFTYYDQTQYGWSTDWLDPEVVALDPAAVTADSADPFGVTYDETGRITQFTYDEFGNAVRSIDPNGVTVNRTFDDENRVLREERLTTSEATEQPLNQEINQWSSGGVTAVDAGEIDGRSARLFTSADGATWSAAYSANIPSKTGQVSTFEVSLQAVGEYTSQSLGLHDGSWGNVANSTAVILSGPGQVVNVVGGLWRVEGLSTTEATRIQIKRTATSDATMRAYVYVDHPGGYRDGAQLKVAGPELRVEEQAITRFVYDTEGHLVYAIDAEGGVVEYRYASNGFLTWTITYPEHAYDGASAQTTHAEINAWRNAISDRSSTQMMRHSFDARGNRTQTTRYGGANPNGSASASPGFSRSYYTYNQAGQLLSTYQNGEAAQTFQFDGLGRTTYSVDTANNATEIAFDDENSKTIVTNAAGFVTTQTFNRAGELISVSEAEAAGGTSTTITNRYDPWQKIGDTGVWASGTLNNVPAYSIESDQEEGDVGVRVATPNTVQVQAGDTVTLRYHVRNDQYSSGLQHFIKIDWPGLDSAAGNTASVVAGPGSIVASGSTEFRVSGLSTSSVTTIEITGTAPATGTVHADLRLNTSQTSKMIRASQAIWSVASTTSVSAAGNLREYEYDVSGRLRKQTNERGYSTYFLYDNSGRKIADITEQGHLTEYQYDDQNRLIATTRFANWVYDRIGEIADPDNRLTIEDIRPTQTTGDQWAWTIYDAGGRVAQTIDGMGGVTEYEYDASNNLVRTVAYANTVDITSFETDAPTEPFVVAQYSARDIVVRNFYDKAGRLIASLDGEGFLSEMVYDQVGQLVSEKVYRNPTALHHRANGSLEALLGSVGTIHRSAHSVYDGQGLVRYTVDNLGYVTKFSYNRAQKLTETRQLINPTTVTDFTFDAVAAAAGTASTDRITKTTYDSAGRVRTVTDPIGLVTTFDYDEHNQVQTVTYADGSNTRTQHSFRDNEGKLRFVVDGDGYVIGFEYDEQDNQTLQRQYDTSLYDNTINLTITASTEWQDIQSALTGVFYVDETFTYDVNYSRLERATNGLGEETLNQYLRTGDLGRVIQNNTTADESSEYFFIDQAGRTTAHVQAQLETAVQKNGAAGEQIQTNFYYDAFGRVTSTRDPNGNTTSTTYDRRGLVTSVTNAEGGVTTYEYNGYGELVKATDPRGNSTYTYYDGLGRAIVVRDAENYVTSTDYTAFGEVERVKRYEEKTSSALSTISPPAISPQSGVAVTSFIYDTAGRVTQTTDAEGYVERYAYNKFGERVSMTAKSNTSTRVEWSGIANVTTYEYNNRGLLIREVLPSEVPDDNEDGALTPITNAYTYDARGNRVTMTEAEGLPEERTTTYVYDAANQLISTVGAARNYYSVNSNQVRSFTPTETITYDARGNVITTRDAGSNRTVFFYDDLNRKVVEIDALGTYTAYEYDKNSNVIRIRVFETPVGFQLDGGAQEQAPNAPSGPARETLFEYDRLNRLIRSSVVGVHNGHYNGSSWVANAENFETEYVYDANGNVIQTIDPLGNEIHAYYDKLGRKTHQVDAGNYLTTWAYSSEGNVETEVQYAVPLSSAPGTNPPSAPSGTEARTTHYTYDRVGNRLTETRLGVQVHNETSPREYETVNAFVEYTYNGLGQVLTKTEATGDTITYNYDDGGRLMFEQRTAFSGHTNGNVTPRVDYIYDGLGNLTHSIAAGAAGIDARTTRYEYGAGGQLESMYDAEYNRTDYFYDTMGRVLVERYSRTQGVDSGASLKTEGKINKYDKLGRVIEQSVSQLNTQTQRWEYGDITRMAYNAFGDVIATGVNVSPYSPSTWQQQNKYDMAGRLWATNSGDGIWKFFGYDKNGNQTIAITSAGRPFSSSTTFQTAYNWINRTDVNATYTVYDSRNLATQVIEEQRQIDETGDNSDAIETHNLVTTRSYNAFGEVENETDALGNSITYTYNTMGKVIRQELPAEWLMDETNRINYIRPTLDFFYDQSGRLVAQLDANGDYAPGGSVNQGAKSKDPTTGNLTQFELLAGTGYGGSEALIAKQINADGGITENFFDVHGDVRKTRILVSGDGVAGGQTDIWRTTNQQFDRLGRLTRVQKEVGTHSSQYLYTSYKYDELGQRVEVGNSVQSTASGGGQYLNGNTEVTEYDTQGRIVRTRAFGGDETTYTYTWDASLEAAGTGISNSGGWVKETEYDYTNTSGVRLSTGLSESETTDLFGRAISRTNMGEQDTTYTYNRAGWLTREFLVSPDPSNNPGPDITQTTDIYYFNTGLLKEKIASIGPRSLYRYDELGRRVYEAVASFENPLLNNNNNWVKVAYATYDNLGNLSSYKDYDGPGLGHSSTPFAQFTYSYDANGNVMSTSSKTPTISSNGTVTISTQTRTTHNRYDSMNRQVLVDGIDVDGTINGIQRGTNNQVERSVSILYNKAGDRDHVITTYKTGVSSTKTDREDYDYDRAGNLSRVYIREYSASSQGNLRSTYTYDALGRLTRQIDKNQSGAEVFDKTVSYNAKGQLSSELTETLSGSNTLRASSVYSYIDLDGQYALGQIGRVTTTNWRNGSSSGAPNTRTDYRYNFFEAATVARVQFNPNTSQSGFYNNGYDINVMGWTNSVEIGDGRHRTVGFVYDQNGQVLSREEDERDYNRGNPKTLYFRFDGKQLGEVSNNGTNNTTYEEAIDELNAASPNSPGPFRRGSTSADSHIDTNSHYDAINPYQQSSSSRTSYTVQGGESLQSVAASVWGDASLWYKIAQSNGLSAGSPLRAGQVLNLPSNVVRSSNNSGTFKVYNPGEALGDVAPTSTAPPKGNKCGAFGAILLAVVAVGVAIWAGPGAIAFFEGLKFGAFGAAVAGGALAGAAGSVASQGVGLATGIQSKFSFKSVGLAALGGAVGGALQGVNAFGEIAKGAEGSLRAIGNAAVRGALGSAINQGIGVATGLQDKFSFAGVAAAGVAAGVGQFASEQFGASSLTAVNGQSFSNIAANTAVGGVRLLASAATRSAIEGSSFGRAVGAGLPDVIGQVIGEALIGSRNTYRELAYIRRAADAAQQIVDEIRRIEQQLDKSVAGGTGGGNSTGNSFAESSHSDDRAYSSGPSRSLEVSRSSVDQDAGIATIWIKGKGFSAVDRIRTQPNNFDVRGDLVTSENEAEDNQRRSDSDFYIVATGRGWSRNDSPSARLTPNLTSENAYSAHLLKDSDGDHRLQIILSLDFNFIDAQNAQWTDDLRQQYINEFENQVQDLWSTENLVEIDGRNYALDIQITSRIYQEGQRQRFDPIGRENVVWRIDAPLDFEFSGDADRANVATHGRGVDWKRVFLPAGAVLGWNNIPSSNQSTAAHEIGHVFGLPDEYQSWGRQEGTNEQLNPYLADVESMMHGGEAVRGRHLEPFVDWVREIDAKLYPTDPLRPWRVR